MRMPATRRSDFFKKRSGGGLPHLPGSLGADLGYGFSRYSEIRAAIEVGYASGQLRLGQQAFSSVSGRVGDFRVHYLLDLTDDPVIPRRGVFGESTFHLYDTNREQRTFFRHECALGIFQAHLAAGIAIRLGEAGTTFGSKNTGFRNFSWAGLLG